MKVLVLNPPFLKRYSRPQRSPAVTKSGTLYFPIWLASCAGVLEQSGFDVTLLDAPARDLDETKVLKECIRLRPKLIVVDTSTPSAESDINFCKKIKDILPESFIVLVGTHVSALPEKSLVINEGPDAVARGEYDFTIRDLALLLAGLNGSALGERDLRSVRGLSFKLFGRVVHNEDRPFIKNLDQLPWVSRIYKKHLKMEDYFNANALYPMVTLMTGRGCPFRCSFCLYPQTLTGRTYRFRTVEDVVNEIEYIVKEMPGTRSIFFEDDTLTAKKKRCVELCDAIIRQGIEVSWTANSRVEVELETMLKMKASGCRELCVGFESGNDRILEAMRKGTTRARMVQFMRDARRAGILVHGCFIIGFPGETLEDIRRTIEFAIELEPDTVQFYPIMVYPGTEAYEEYSQRGWLTAKSYRDWLTEDGLHNCVVRNENFSSVELVRLCDDARRKFYLRTGYIVYKSTQMLRKPSEFVRTAKAARTFFNYLIRGSKV